MNLDKLIKFIVVITIIGYLVIVTFKDGEFSKQIDGIKNIDNNVQILNIKEYLYNNDNYYYKIDGATYCIKPDDLKKDDVISDKYLNKIKNYMIEAKYYNNDFIVKIKDNCESTF